MIVVSDTSPLNYLSRTGHVWILPELFGQVLVPQAVLTEMLHPQSPAEVRAFASLPPTWLECAITELVPPGMHPSLGNGEREAISLALEKRADALLIDDYAGRREAISRHIPARGTLAILLQASLRGYLDFPSAFEQIKKMGFRVSRALEESVYKTYLKGRPEC